MQVAARGGALAFVVLWLLSSSLQAVVPFWLPFAILAAIEIELRRRRDPGAAPRSTRAARPERRLPGAGRRRPRLGGDGRRGRRAGFRACAATPGAALPPPCSSRARRRPGAVRLRLPGRPRGWLVVRPGGDAGEGRASLHGRGGAHRRPARAGRLRRELRLHRRRLGRSRGRVHPPRACLPRAVGLPLALPRRVRAEVGARDDAAFAITVLAHEAIAPARGAQRGGDGVPGTAGGRPPRRAPRPRRGHGRAR